ncbi:MAG: hypothetical protein H7Y13_16420 [Sphingobacteriaceae bacterium]|nr:hypothetical protein [Sphingobacteriaceae bacterium]
MKRITLLALAILPFLGCGGLNKQTNQLKALEDCKYEITSADSISVANINVKDLIGKDKLDLVKMPRLALALLRKNVPLKARVNLVINNPTNQLAAINQFEYKVLIKNRELAGGFVNQKIVVSPHGGTTSVPIHINSNIYEVLSDDKAMDAIYDFLIGAGDNTKERKGNLTIKIKPTLTLGNKQIQYPGYITIDKEVSSKILL